MGKLIGKSMVSGVSGSDFPPQTNPLEKHYLVGGFNPSEKY